MSTMLAISPADTYAGNVATAARALLSAVFTFKSPAPSANQRLRDIRQLFSLANQYESMAPNLASELRYFAGKL